MLPPGFLLVTVSDHSLRSSCFLSTDWMILSVIHGLSLGVLFVTFGTSSLQCLSSVWSKHAVNSSNFVEGVSWLPSPQVQLQSFLIWSLNNHNSGHVSEALYYEGSLLK